MLVHLPWTVLVHLPWTAQALFGDQQGLALPLANAQRRRTCGSSVVLHASQWVRLGLTDSWESRRQQVYDDLDALGHGDGLRRYRQAQAESAADQAFVRAAHRPVVGNASVAGQVQGVPKLLHHYFYGAATIEALHPQNAQWRAQWLKHFPIPEYTHMLWDKPKAGHFLAKHFPDFYRDTWLRYPREILRADSVRYYLLYHFGGRLLDVYVHIE
jgi:hypothetical protein